MDNMVFEHSYCRSVDLLRVVYIEYHDGIPHSAIAEQNGYIRNFDFEPDCKEIEMFMYYNSGSGGEIRKIQAPHYADEYKGATYWMHKDAKYRGKPINITRLDTPITYDGNPNPFDNARQIYAQEYCKMCNKYYDEDACPDHHEVNDNGELIYIDGTKADT